MHTLKFRQYYEGDDDSNPEWNYFDLRNGKMVVDGGWKAPQQFTGLTDCQGVEIYEGDIVQDVFTWKSGTKERTETFIEQVIWNGNLGAFLLEAPTRKETMQFLGVYAADIEVIGNIYENKELLTADNPQ